MCSFHIGALNILSSEVHACDKNSKDVRSLLFNYLENCNTTKITCALDMSLSFVRNVFRSDKYVASYRLSVRRNTCAYIFM